MEASVCWVDSWLFSPGSVVLSLLMWLCIWVLSSNAFVFPTSKPSLLARILVSIVLCVLRLVFWFYLSATVLWFGKFYGYVACECPLFVFFFFSRSTVNCSEFVLCWSETNCIAFAHVSSVFLIDMGAYQCGCICLKCLPLLSLLFALTYLCMPWIVKNFSFNCYLLLLHLVLWSYFLSAPVLWFWKFHSYIACESVWPVHEFLYSLFHCRLFCVLKVYHCMHCFSSCACVMLLLVFMPPIVCVHSSVCFISSFPLVCDVHEYSFALLVTLKYEVFDWTVPLCFCL